MSDDAQVPEAPGSTAGGTPPHNPHDHDDVWAAPADSGAARAQPPQAPPRDVAPPMTQIDLGGQVAPGPPDSTGAVDPWALPEFDPPVSGAGPAGAPAAGSPPGASSVHEQQTMTSFPAQGDPTATPVPPARPWAGPGTPQAPVPPVGPGAAVPNPFAPPAADPLPPPPIAPDGPGQVPYGYPGGPQSGYGHPAPQPSGYGTPGYGAPDPGYHGWTGMAPLPSNGMGITGLVLGIISAVLFCFWPLAIGLGVMAVIFSALGRGKASRGEATNPGHALAGLICGAVGILLGTGFGALVLFTSSY
ncbi:DUF4190 domain-containing protein [Streptomyces cathayae]|uniref:DUF4190 domain-containing protein n=1 Tax=Streptomyces cathayae TaxID=3031124 RepID=A0ABY8JWX4_9ACTN|nr:hypothetical protein [Streptomyces sp. HUAS 5]WGD40500.1 hypothetical protein PYS65_10295 [Streptomyces sp. HUAS 5]